MFLSYYLNSGVLFFVLWILLDRRLKFQNVPSFIEVINRVESYILCLIPASVVMLVSRIWSRV